MTRNSALEREFAIRGPWATQFVIDGETYGGDLCYDDDERITRFHESFPGVRSILDLGSLEGVTLLGDPPPEDGPSRAATSSLPSTPGSATR